ncbi:MAG TPA: hypothetical protein VFU50_10905 [Terriglobales bacterium]|nr:hypothetical protein [Terriglobales bacterium]
MNSTSIMSPMRSSTPANTAMPPSLMSRPRASTILAVWSEFQKMRRIGTSIPLRSQRRLRAKPAEDWAGVAVAMR